MQSSLITSTMLHTLQSVSAEKGASSSCTAASANKDILAKYVKLAVLAESVKAGGLFVVDYNNHDNHVPNIIMISA